MNKRFLLLKALRIHLQELVYQKSRYKEGLTSRNIKNLRREIRQIRQLIEEIKVTPSYLMF